MWEAIVCLAFVGGLALLAFKVNTGALSKMLREAAAAARTLGLSPISESREAAEARFGLEPGTIQSDPAVFEGTMRGVTVRLGAFSQLSNTAVDGVRIPVVVTRVMAQRPTPASYELRISRRVFGDPDNDLSLSPELDKKWVIKTTDPAAARMALGSPAIQRQLLDFVLDGKGLAFITRAHVETMAFHPSAEMIRAKARDAAKVALLLVSAVPIVL